MFESVRLKCSSCGHTLDTLIDRAERDIAHYCDQCDSLAMHRVFMAPAIRTADSASQVEGISRFGGVREQIALRKAKTSAREQKDKVSEQLVNKEINKLAKKD
jgi:hypothetical protein